jgi:phosphoribosylformylglycinamidine (FGAM) synthase-like enzyme
MITKSDLEALSIVRLDDAKVLFQAGRNPGAYYLSGYAVELAIKACIAKVFQANAIPDKAFVTEIYSHNLKELLGLAGLTKQFQDDTATTPNLAAAWGVASKWNEASRYAMWDNFAAASILNAVGDLNHGVLQWLKKHW